MKKKPIILVDGSTYIYRAFYATPPLRDAKGRPTNALHGFFSMVLKLIEEESPTYFCVVFDSKEPSFRTQLDPNYKSHREKPSEDLLCQIPWIIQMTELFGMAVLSKSGYEADDIIGTLSHYFVHHHNEDILIISSDKDLMQLVSPHITLYDTMKKIQYDEKKVHEKWGVWPNQMIDFIALMGDSSDNIPGVMGVGKKTAVLLLEKFNSLDGIYQNLDQIKPSVRLKLETHKESAYLSQKLATILTDVPVSISLHELLLKQEDSEKLFPLLDDFDLVSLSRRFGHEKKKLVKKSTYQTIQTVTELEKIISIIKEKKFFALDTETNSLSAYNAECVGISLCYQSHEAFYIPFGHYQGKDQFNLQPGQLAKDTVISLLRPILEDPTIKKVGQHLKYDFQVLKTLGINLCGISDDTLLLAYLVDPNEKCSLPELSKRYLEYSMLTFEEVTRLENGEKILFPEVAIDKATFYSAEDSDVTFQLYEILKPMVVDRGLLSIYETIDVPLLHVLASMEYHGIFIDKQYLLHMKEVLEKEIEIQKKKLYDMAHEEVNINSPKQLRDFLFTRLGLTPTKKTKTGFSTDESVLRALAHEHPICGLILEMRELMKINSTFVVGLLDEIDPRTHRIHTSFNQTLTSTGRLSSSHPNLQNIPSNDILGFNVRCAMRGEGDDYMILSADYSQIELRILAALSQDPVLTEAFLSDQDIHMFTAKLIFGENIPPDEVEAKRSIAKTINFGVLYGQTPYGLSQMLHIPQSTAQDFIAKYFERYPRVQPYLKSLSEKAQKNGYAETYLGRRRYIQHLHSQNRFVREQALRFAMNSPIQGSASDVIKLAMVSIFDAMEKEKMHSKLLLQVHDELVFEVYKPEKEKILTFIKLYMEKTMNAIPLKVHYAWGSNWRDMVDID